MCTSKLFERIAGIYTAFFPSHLSFSLAPTQQKLPIKLQPWQRYGSFEALQPIVNRVQQPNESVSLLEAVDDPKGGKEV